MIRQDLFIQIERQKSSYDYKINQDLDTFNNNIKNNCQDKIILLKNNMELYSHNLLQSIANYPGNFINDSLAEGDFTLVCFVTAGESFADPNNPNRIKIHGIINAKTLNGDLIGNDSHILYKDGSRSIGRVLMHSTYYPPENKELLYAYSEACLMHKTLSLIDTFNQFLIENGVNSGDFISCNLKEV